MAVLLTLLEGFAWGLTGCVNSGPWGRVGV